jgi:hypothetical protein
MDRRTAATLRRLDTRLRSVYENAARTAARNHRTLIGRLERFNQQIDEGNWEHLTAAQLRTFRENYIRRIDRVEGISRAIANDIARSNEVAVQLIQDQNINIAGMGYNAIATDLTMQLRGDGVNIRWNMYSHSRLQALLSEQPQSPFTKVAFDRMVDNSVIPSRLMPRLQNHLAEAIINQEGVQQITTRLRAVCSMELNRARRIARTELKRAGNQGRFIAGEQARREFGIEADKFWVHTMHAKEPREAHEALNGTKADENGYFNVNGHMAQYPLDPSLPAAEVVFCSCDFVYRAKRADGSYYGEPPAEESDTNSLSSGKIGDTDGETTITDVKRIDPNNDAAVNMEINDFAAKYANAKVEYARVITENGEVYTLQGGAFAVDPSMLGDNALRGATIIHNHPVEPGSITGDSFSLDDLRFAARHQTGPQYLLSGERRDMFEFTRSVSEGEIYGMWKSAEHEMLEIAMRSGIAPSSRQGAVMRQLGRREGVLYRENI